MEADTGEVGGVGIRRRCGGRVWLACKAGARRPTSAMSHPPSSPSKVWQEKAEKATEETMG
jgi:hypothetical protein